MTREEREIALYCLKASSDYHSEVCEECIKYPNCDHTMQDDVTETIVKALEQEPCEDAISRQAVLDMICNVDGMEGFENSNIFAKHYVNNVKALPSVTPPQKMGKWVEEVDDYGEVMRWHCDKCYEDSGFATTCKWDYCPNCGAKMEVNNC